MSDKGFSMESITGSKSTLVVLIGAAIALLGSFMNWVTVSGGGISVSAGGMSDGGDGVITLIVAIGTAAAAIFLKGLWMVLVGGIVAAAGAFLKK